MNILVTGAAGFIGSHISERLLKSGHRITGLDNFDSFYNPVIKESNANILSTYPNFNLVRGDIRDTELILNLFRDSHFERVIHLAAKAGVRPSISEASEYMDVNVTGLTSLLEAMRLNGVKRMIFASSSSIYGNQKKIPFSESDDVSFPISPYSASKRSGELICHVYHHLYGIEVACLRLFTVYGPRQRPDLAIHKFTDLALHGKSIEIYGDGNTLRDYTYISDIVDGFVSMNELQNLTYEIINLGFGKPIALSDVVDALQKALQRKIEIVHKGIQAGDVDQTYADVSKANDFFGFKAKVSLEKGVREFVNWYRDTHQS